MSDDRTGKCMCGAVRYTAHGVKPEVAACHCDMCRRWASGPLLVAECERLELQSEDALGVITSSKWAERGFCRQCGSGVFFRITAEGPMKGETSVTLGTLDDQSGLTLTREWFVDRRPEVYALEGEHECMTGAQIVAQFGSALGIPEAE